MSADFCTDENMNNKIYATVLCRKCYTYFIMTKLNVDLSIYLFVRMQHFVLKLKKWNVNKPVCFTYFFISLKYF